jgi:hypothetical protein
MVFSFSSTYVNGEGQMLEDVFESEETLCEYTTTTAENGQFTYKTRCIAQRIALAGDEAPIKKEVRF